MVKPLKNSGLKFIIILTGLSLLLVPKTVHAVRDITFPIIGPSSYSNDYNAPRASGPHHAIDIFASKGQKLISAINGTITFVAYPQASWGYSFNIRDNTGYTYRYIHVNNDTPGTDDGKGGGMHAYAPYVKAGNPVVAGQHLGWVGDSGNAENTSPHLHFEMFQPDGDVANPYSSLNEARRRSSPVTPPSLPGEIVPFSLNSEIGISLGAADIDNDNETELVVGAGKGGGPRVKVYDNNKTLYNNISFYAYDSAFKGGIDVAVGNLDADPQFEIVTTAGPGGGPHVRVFDLNGTVINEFFAYSPTFSGGVNVDVGDFDNDGVDEIITGPKKGGGPHVRLFEANGTIIREFYAFSETFKGGIDVAAGDLVDGNADEFMAAAGPGGGPHVRAWRTDGTLVTEFYAYSDTFKGGVRLSSADVYSGSKDEIGTIAATLGSPRVKFFGPTGSQILNTAYAIEEWWRGPYDVALDKGSANIGIGTNRRAAIWNAWGGF